MYSGGQDVAVHYSRGHYHARKSGMKVIMLQSVRGVGQSDTIVEVADGYALNALIPAGKAAQATPERIAAHKKRLSEGEAQMAATNAQLAATLKSMDGKRVSISVRANKQGHLFKGITKKDVAHALSEQLRATISGDMIAELDAPIKQTGERQIRLAAANATAMVTLLVEAA